MIRLPRRIRRPTLWLGLLVGVSLCLSLAAQGPRSSQVSLPSDDRAQSPSWWPTKGTATRSTYVGTAECAKCHEKQALTYIRMAMSQAAAPAAYSQMLLGRNSVSAERPPHRYEITRGNGSLTYSVTRDDNSLAEPLQWAFGLGHKGQTYIYQHNGAFYESRLSFYRALDALDLTTGHSTSTPDALDSALGRRLSADEARRCFACHTTGSSNAGHFDPTHITPGVTCEACHGPGAPHVASMKIGKIGAGRRAVLNPHRLDPVVSVDFCGACHRTWADVVQGGFTGVINVRFQPYRLESSRCWQATKGDARLVCAACHDPHEELNLSPTSYDQNCLTCHVASPLEKTSSDHPGAGCPVAAKDCVTCHMPQVEVPSMHASFADHRIRIARPNEPYPN
jgi:Cytochrome c554 and c-prime